ncbi:hypothetical protein BDV98DRAFT_563365 [Pterulicium gracile]|uniref:HAD-like domain-containing protein n=1 Tax=Pterulicium gracile TaxID=1884261 RepID=A0A5C3QPS2_9AGAR|nr:hypothetical protein BDV98DRAFT_563365 [Pterula gracilis]
MSIGGSASELESPTAESSNPLIADEEFEAKSAAFAKLATISPPTSSGPVIAIDLDDVLSETNASVAAFHNETYGSDMPKDLSTFYYYYYWKNPGWGSLHTTFDKVSAYYASGRIYKTAPIPGAREGVQSLRDAGYRLIVVTARTNDTADESFQWVNHHFPGLFDSVICTGAFKDKHSTGHEVVTKLSKAQVCHDLGARLLIDDSSENALQCATFAHPTPVLLFGDYQWNQRRSLPEDNREDMTYDVRLAREGPEFWAKEHFDVPEGVPIHRVNDWAAVIRWVKKARDEGRL